MGSYKFFAPELGDRVFDFLELGLLWLLFELGFLAMSPTVTVINLARVRVPSLIVRSYKCGLEEILSLETLSTRTPW